MKKRQQFTTNYYKGNIGYAKQSKRPTDYGRQLFEKQQIKFFYGLRERQFKNYFLKATKIKGNAGNNLVVLLEKRLDNAIFRSGLALTRRQARQFVVHGHIYVNNKKVNIPSFQVKPGEIITLKPTSKIKPLVNEILKQNKNYNPPAWLKLDRANLKVEILANPIFEEGVLPFNVQMVAEFYSR